MNVAAKGLHLSVAFAAPLLADHLPPDRVTLPCDMLALVNAQLSHRYGVVVLRHAFCVQRDQPINSVVKFIFRCLLEGMRLFHHIV